ncbi:Protein GPA-6 [Aphelenchoides avenae]|nr:Protein GPA-6 [Aphelenchus avenae]
MGTTISSRPSSTKDSARRQEELAKARSKQIDRDIVRDSSKNSSRFEILLLGGSECGKTTIFKQIRILHLNGFSREDRLAFTHHIRMNAIEALGQLLDACQKNRIVHETMLQDYVERFRKFRKMAEERDGEEINIPKDMDKTMGRIWRSAPVQMVYQRRYTFALLDSAKYFLDKVEQVADPSYEPSAQDILQCRYRTIGTQEVHFIYKKVNFRMVDVGGQRSERRKWIHCFDNVSMNRLHANRNIFKTIIQSDYFKDAAIVLFMNKYDTFLDKLKYSPLVRYFPDFQGGEEQEEASKFMFRYFQRCVRDQAKYYAFFTTATDTRNVDFVFGSAVSHLINQNLKATGAQ